MLFRRAKEVDLDRLVDIHTSAYPDPRGDEPRRRKFRHSAYGDFDDLWVVERGNSIVAHAFLVPMEMGFGGARVRVGGVATVGVAPEARGRGVGAALLDHLHVESLARGDAVNVLHAFRQGFYARRGYAPASACRRLRFHPRAVPSEWRDESVRAARGEDLDAIIACYDRALLRGTGMVTRLRRSWELCAVDPRRTWLVLPGTGHRYAGHELVGYVSWTLSQPEPHARTTMVVHDLVADDDGARRALLGAIGAQRDQVAEVALDVPEGDSLDRALLDMDQARFGTEEVEHAIGEVVAGPMVRIVDVARAVESRGYAADGVLDFAAGDGSTFRLEAKDGRAHARPNAGEPTVRFRGDALAAVLYGALAPSRAARLGWVEGAEDALHAADALLALPPYFALDAF